MKIALALGGGAARGLAHIGVLKVLEKEKFPFHLIVGTSIGAVVGGLYALEPDAISLEKRILNYLTSEPFKKLRMDFFHQHTDLKNNRRTRFLSPMPGFLEKGIFFGKSLTRLSFVSPEIIQENAHYLFGDSTFQESALPVHFIATDMDSGIETILSQGLMCEAASASCAIPSLMPPVYINGKPLVDGGCVSLVPIDAARQVGADMVVASNVSKEIISPDYRLKNGVDVAIRAYEITLFSLRTRQLKEADVIILPEVGDLNWADFNQAGECIKRGEKAAQLALKDIQKKKRLKQVYSFLKIGY